MTRLIFLGLPGAGKGTQAKILSSSLKILHISTGDILRAERKNKTELGIQAQSYMDQGELVPNELILEMIRIPLTSSDANNGWILDGFPRNTSQALFLDSFLNDLNQNYNLAIYLHVSDDIVIPRLRDRAIKEGRSDDADESVIKRRLEEYHDQTSPLIALYNKRNQLVQIDGSMPMDNVTDALTKAIKDFGKTKKRKK